MAGGAKSAEGRPERRVRLTRDGESEDGVESKIPLNLKLDPVGILGGLPDAYLPEKERGKALTWEGLVVDVGLPIDRLRGLVSVGDFITFRQSTRKLMGDRATGKALDNRVACWLGIESVRQLVASGKGHAAEIVAGANAGALTVILDRREAIAAALTEAKSGDIVLIAGKGHETTQTVGTQVLPFDDREVARAWLHERGHA